MPRVLLALNWVVAVLVKIEVENAKLWCSPRVISVHFGVCSQVVYLCTQALRTRERGREGGGCMQIQYMCLTTAFIVRHSHSLFSCWLLPLLALCSTHHKPFELEITAEYSDCGGLFIGLPDINGGIVSFALLTFYHVFPCYFVCGPVAYQSMLCYRNQYAYASTTLR